MSHQRTVSLPSSQESDDTEKQETRVFFFQYMSKRAQKDEDLNASDAKTIQEEGEQVVQSVEGKEAVEVASRLADWGKPVYFRMKSWSLCSVLLRRRCY